MSRLREPVRRHLVAAVARARPQERVEALRARLAREKPASLELALVVGADGRRPAWFRSPGFFPPRPERS